MKFVVVSFLLLAVATVNILAACQNSQICARFQQNAANIASITRNISDYLQTTADQSKVAELCELVEDAFLGLDMIPESWEAYPDLKCPLSTPEKLEFFDNYFRNLSKYFKIESGGKAFGGKAFGGEAATQHECDDFTNTVCELMELLGFTLKPGES